MVGEKPYWCYYCGESKRFIRGGQLINHLRTHTGERPFKCTLCPAAFSSSTNLKMHTLIHTGERKYSCNTCNKRFTRNEYLQKHVEKVHQGIKRFTCPICNKNFKGHLKLHMRTHDNDRPYQCTKCNANFKQKSHLHVHLRTHTGEKPYMCKYCKRSFSHSNSLQTHIKAHKGERNYQCQLCSKAFLQLPHLKKHMKYIHKKDKPYVCMPCDEYFKTKSELESHKDLKKCVPTENAPKCSAHDLALSKNDFDDLIPHSGVDNNANLTFPKEIIPQITSLESPALKDSFEASKDSESSLNVEIDEFRKCLVLLLKKVGHPEQLQKLGFGHKLVDEVLITCLEHAGKTPDVEKESATLESLIKNTEIFLEWTIPKKYLKNFQKQKKGTFEIMNILIS